MTSNTINSPISESANLQNIMENLFSQNQSQNQMLMDEIQTLKSYNQTQNQILMDEIQTLKSQLKSKELETIEDVLLSAASIMFHSFSENTPVPSAVSTTWKNASRMYPLCKSIKKSFAAEEITSDDERLIKLSKLMMDPKQIKDKPKPSKTLCSRCDRSGHTKASCFAKTNANGVKLE